MYEPHLYIYLLSKIIYSKLLFLLFSYVISSNRYQKLIDLLANIQVHDDLEFLYKLISNKESNAFSLD